MGSCTNVSSVEFLTEECSFHSEPGFVNYKKGCTRLAAASDKVYQLLAHVRWFSPGTPASFTTKTGRHDITEILLKVALSTINQLLNQSISSLCVVYIYIVRHPVLGTTDPVWEIIF
jgi:hypothetical protein